MVRKRLAPPKTGIEYLKSINYDKYLEKIGLGKDDHEFWKQTVKALLCSYIVVGAVWAFDYYSPLGWFNMRPMTKSDREMAPYYQRRVTPYPGDKEAMEEFIAKGGLLGTAIGPKEMLETDSTGVVFQKEMQSAKFHQEAQKLWVRIRNEAVQDLLDKGYQFD